MHFIIDTLLMLNIFCNKFLTSPYSCLYLVGLGFHDAGQQQRESYEDSDFNSQLTDLWTNVAPLYRQLHAYVRRRLVERYGSERVRPDGPLPAHLLGENMLNRGYAEL
jgi:hypothetical protein